MIELRKLGRTEQIAAAQLSARAMRDDPVHIAVFGTNPEHRRRQLTRFFATLLRVLQAPPFSLWEGNRLLGVAGGTPGHVLTADGHPLPHGRPPAQPEPARAMALGSLAACL